VQLSTIGRGQPYASWLFRLQSLLEAYRQGQMGLWGLVDGLPASLLLAWLGFLLQVFYRQSLFAPMDIILP
jgi:hypothetical protein